MARTIVVKYLHTLPTLPKETARRKQLLKRCLIYNLQTRNSFIKVHLSHDRMLRALK